MSFRQSIKSSTHHERIEILETLFSDVNRVEPKNTIKRKRYTLC